MIPFAIFGQHALVLVAFATGADLSTLNGKTFQGELQSLTEKELTFRTASEVVTLPLNQVLRLDLQSSTAPAGAGKYSDVELMDGTLLHCSKYSLKGKEIELQVLGLESAIRVPLAHVSSILNEAQDPGTRAEWQEKVISKRGSRDIVAVKVNESLNSIEGTLGESTEKGEVAFSYDSRGQRRERTIDPNLAFGLLFFRRLPPEAPVQLCRLVDSSQNSFSLARLVMGSGSFGLTTITGAKLDLPKSAVARLDFSNDKIIYLSDLKPMELIERSTQGLTYTLRTDRNLESTQPLQIRGEVFARGLALHAHTEVTYSLDAKYRKFEAILGMDDSVGGDGKPVVRIEADGKELFNRVVTRKDDRITLDLDMQGVRQLRIIVGSQRILGFGDHVDLVNARLSK